MGQHSDVETPPPGPDCWPLDSLLRRHGFRVVERPRSGEAVWERRGERYTQGAALHGLPPGEVAAARREAEGWKSRFGEVTDEG